ncbi:MAG: GGDEF domain-containing protein [Actinobacteria bacterium]|nr:GGDEF domain-containing protein [Actinomycetota bacterium]
MANTWTFAAVAAVARQDVFFVLALTATIATIALLVVTVRAERGRRREPIRPLDRRSTRGDPRDPRAALALVGDTLAATHNPKALLPVILRATAEATGAAAGQLIEDGAEISSVGSIPAGVEPLSLELVPPGEGSTMMLLYAPTGGFGEEAERLAAWLASQAAIALENARLHHVVQRQAVTDELTGLVNRRRFMSALGHEIARTTRTMPPSIILSDLDDFKRVNDRFGHPIGDGLLQSFADALRSHVRDIDIPARLGGEEFAVLLPETTLAGALAVAQRLQLFLTDSPLNLHSGHDIHTTSSFGVAELVEGEAADALLRRADAALYQAKAEGKNRVVAAEVTIA